MPSPASHQEGLIITISVTASGQTQVCNDPRIITSMVLIRHSYADKLDRLAVISINKSCNHKMLNSSVVMVVRLGALLHILSVASLLEGLPCHVLLDVLTLLPGSRGALPTGGTGAVLLIHVLGDCGGDITADLVRDIITDLTRSGDIVADLVI